ncbi:hypothetical protein e112_125 [Escherichia phage vB_EcoM_112]|uniref:Uncharacterized protein n=1 Tax=Escherichia phage vB_EcoM_112 TaxID=1495285 RepID=A0A023ZVB6_9CAUD|nr:hypothetical protein e112_125 [Escherichia phage vB_EcoM_112]AHY83323.1 hypothetical protein e112_125 [Escherichia phage vB_EcoM_112]
MLSYKPQLENKFIQDCSLIKNGSESYAIKLWVINPLKGPSINSMVKYGILFISRELGAVHKTLHPLNTPFCNLYCLG